MSSQIGIFSLLVAAVSMVTFVGTLGARGKTVMDFDLRAYQWKKRLILIFAPSTKSESYKAQAEMLRGHTEGMLDRDLIVAEVFEAESSRCGEAVLSSDSVLGLREKFSVGPGQFQVLLIGKDGTVKLRSSRPVSILELFSLIDAMPMRQEEMRKKSRSSS
jgi:hypothetical protein